MISRYSLVNLQNQKKTELFREFTILDLNEINILTEQNEKNKYSLEKIDRHCLLGSYMGVSFFELFKDKEELLA